MFRVNFDCKNWYCAMPIWSDQGVDEILPILTEQKIWHDDKCNDDIRIIFMIFNYKDRMEKGNHSCVSPIVIDQNEHHLCHILLVSNLSKKKKEIWISLKTTRVANNNWNY